MTHSNKVAHDEAGYIFFDASKEIISIFFFWKNKKETKSFVLKLNVFTFC